MTAVVEPTDTRLVPEFCAVCWGAGRIFYEAANGEGLIPVPCAECGGKGAVWVVPE